MKTVLENSAYLRLARTLLLRAEGFRHCADSTLDQLVEGGTLQRLPRGTWVCRRNQRFEELCLILQGTLESSVSLLDAQRHLVAYLSVGDILGTVCCVDRLPMPHDVRTHSDTILLHMPLTLISRLRSIDAGISRAFEVQLAARTRMFYERLSDTLLLPFESRLARMLLELVSKFGVERGERTLIVLRIPQIDLADLLGASRQRVNQALKEFERRGLLTLRRSTIESIEVEKLRQVAEPTPPAPAAAARPA